MSKKIKIYGERNTNTNYLRRLIELNLNVEQISGVAPRNISRLQRILPGEEIIKDFYFFLTYNKNLGWKHSLVRSVDAVKKSGLDLENLYFVTITKNPYSWLLSLHRNTYHQYYKVKPDFETFLTARWKTVGRENHSKIISNPIELWNIKNSSYLQLSTLNCLNITTESLFHSPEKVIDEISINFDINKLSSTFINFDRSTKNTKKDSAYYQDYYLNERWRENLSENAISVINQHLDKSLMHHFGYKVL